MAFKYRVTYMCVESSPSWGKVGATNSIIFNDYDLKKFADYTPANWQIRHIIPVFE